MNVGKLNSYFGEGAVLKGTLKFKGLLRFDGVFEGDVQTDDTFIVGATGKVRANIKTGDLYNFGGITGDVEANNKISLHADSRLEGNIKAPLLITEEEAYFQGSCYMPPREPSKKAVQKPKITSDREAVSMATAPAPEPSVTAESGAGGGGAAVASAVALALAIGLGGVWYFMGGDWIMGLLPFGGGKQQVVAMAPKPSESVKVTELAPPREEAPSAAEEAKPPEPAVVEEKKSREEVLAERIGESPGDPGPRLELAELLLEKGEYKEAVRTLEEAVDAFKTNDDLRTLLAKTYHRIGREKDAFEQFAILAKSRPNSLEAINNKAFRRMDIGALDEAEKGFKSVLAEDENNFRARLGLATVYSKLEENDKAIAECEAILEIEDDYAPALNRLAWIYAKKGESLEKAEAMSRKSMAVFEDIPEYIDTLSEINYKMGRYDEAIDLIKRAIALVPGDSYYERQLFKFQRAKRRG